MPVEQILHRGREAFQSQAWRDAYRDLSAADKKNPLGPADLEMLATAAYLTGHFQPSNETWSRAHNKYLEEGNIQGAARSAFWLGFSLLNKGEYARGGGWIGRARNLLENDSQHYVEEGYILLPQALKYLGEGRCNDAFDYFELAENIAAKYHDRDLGTLSHLGKGQALIRLGEINKGMSLLDEAMAAVDYGALSPVVTGIVYCAVIEACIEIFDLGRAQEWTEALSDWCNSHPHLVPFRGQCLTRRSEIMQLHGRWSDSMDEANHAINILTREDGEPAAGAAFYQLGELYRLQGDYVQAEEAYSKANRFGRKPQPGLALLRLGQGRLGDAKSSIEQSMREARHIKNRSHSLPAFIEIMIACNDLEKARNGVEELRNLSEQLNVPFMIACTAYAEGWFLLSEGNAHKALECLRKGNTLWADLKAPYEQARTRVLMGRAYREIGDRDSAKMEFESSLRAFSELNAKPDIEEVKRLLDAKHKLHAGGLTSRELEVLQLLASGKTNKLIAGKLFISERTVERHVSNIFNKLNVSSRSEATAYAYKHQLI